MISKTSIIKHSKSRFAIVLICLLLILFYRLLYRKYSNEENESSLLMSKYRNAKVLMNRMTETDDTIDCEELLLKSNDWALNENEFNAKEEFEKVLNSNRNKDPFIYSIITFLYNVLNERPFDEKKESESSDSDDKNSLSSICEIFESE